MKSITASACLLAILFLFTAFSTPSAVEAGYGPLSPQETPFGVYLPSVANEPTPTFTPTPTSIPTATATPTRTPSPTPLPTATATVAPTPLPDGVYTLSSRGYMSGSSYIVFAELINGRDSTVCFTKVVGKFYDAYGSLVATGDSYAMFDNLASQQKSPVELIVTNAPSGITGYTLDISWQNSCSIFKYRNVTILSQSIRDDYGAEVFGEVRNDNPQTLKSVEVVVTFYDGAGGIRYADLGYLSGSTELASGQTGVYSISTFQKDLMPYPYVVQSQGYFTGSGR